MKNDVLPLICGLSLCGAGAVLLYIWYKTRDQDAITDSKSSTTTSAQQQHKNKNVERETKVECTIPNGIVPLVVGRSGANVKAIEEKTKTTIRFREKDENNQICEITGRMDNVKRAAELVKQEASPPPTTTEEIFIPQNSCGKIIGRCGEALQEICRKSMAKVHVDAGDQCDGSTRRVWITGTKTQVNIAKSLIEERIRKDIEAKNIDVESKREPRGSPRNHACMDSLDTKSNDSDDATNAMVSLDGDNSNFNKIDGQLLVYISAVATPSRFWLQLVGSQALELNKLVANMTSYYSAVENQKLHKIADPYLGQIVAAMFKYDSKWYRAEIVGIVPNEFYPRKVVLDLYFVDFGDSEYVTPFEVFELRTDFLKLRFQAIECYLANVKPASEDNSDTWDLDAISRFEDLTHVAKWKKVLSRVVTTKERKQNDTYKKESTSIPGVELYNSIDGFGLNVAHTLISEGYAMPDYPDTNGSNNNRMKINDTIQDQQQIHEKDNEIDSSVCVDKNTISAEAPNSTNSTIPSESNTATTANATGNNQLNNVESDQLNGTIIVTESTLPTLNVPQSLNRPEISNSPQLSNPSKLSNLPDSSNLTQSTNPIQSPNPSKALNTYKSTESQVNQQSQSLPQPSKSSHQISNSQKQSPNPPPTKSRLSAYFSEKDKFTAICENTTNENYENTKIDNRNQTNSFIESERHRARNGASKVTDRSTKKNSNNNSNNNNGPAVVTSPASNTIAATNVNNDSLQTNNLS